MNTLRIIAGQWRGRKLKFIDSEGLRPTTDRVRETVFNWLMADIQGARCLDLFSGSGALSFEALSRGAKEAVLIDQSRAVVQQLKKNQALLSANNMQVLQQDALKFIACYTGEPFDIVFIDPPFYTNMVAETVERLGRSALLSERTLIYIEQEKQLARPALPDHWQLLKEQTAGAVRGLLLTGCLQPPQAPQQLTY